MQGFDCCVHQARDILRTDYRGLHGSSVAACSTDYQPQYRIMLHRALIVVAASV